VLLLAARSGLGDPFAMRLSTSTRGRVKLSRDQSRRLVFKAYGHATKRLARKFRPRTPWETPHEYLTSAETVLDLENPAPLRQLTGLYAQAKYSPATLDSSDGTAAYKALKNLSWKMRKS
jgi:hypothetical protein